MKYTCIREVTTVTGHQEFQVEASSLEDAKRAFLEGEADITHEELSVEDLTDWDFDEIQEAEAEVLQKSHHDYLTEIYGGLSSTQLSNVLPIINQIKDVEKFGRVAKELHASQTTPKYSPPPLQLCQNVFAEINKPTTANDGEWTEAF